VAPLGSGPSCGATSASRHGCHFTFIPPTITVSSGTSDASHVILTIVLAPVPSPVPATSPIR
jgi:hypothetical protein